MRRLRLQGEKFQKAYQKRAAAVKQYLVSAYSIDAGRLATKGFGASKPASPNTTPEGRQNNRRVEFHIVVPNMEGVEEKK